MKVFSYFFVLLACFSLSATPPNCRTTLGHVSLDPAAVFKPLFSTNVEALRNMKLNTTFPSPNFFVPTPKEWLAPDAEHKTQLAIKRGVYQIYPEKVYAVLPEYKAEVESASSKLQERVLKHLTETFPEVYQLKDHVIENRLTGDKFDLNDSSMPPLVRLGLLIQDDITLSVMGKDGQYRMAGGFVSTPSNWSLEDFLGKSMDEIHGQGSVINYAEKLKRTVDGSVGRPADARVMGRNNWFVYTEAAFAQPAFHESEETRTGRFTAKNVGGKTYLRSEIESLFSVPGSSGAPVTVFTIRPRVWPMNFVKENAPEIAKKVAEGVQVEDSGYAEESWNKPLVKFLTTP